MTTVPPLAAEIDRLRAELDEARAEIARLKTPASADAMERAGDCAARFYINRNSQHHQALRDEFARAIEATAREARERAIEEAAQLVIQVAADDDESEIGDRAADRFNSADRRPMSERLRDWNAVIAEGLRALAGKQGAPE